MVRLSMAVRNEARRYLRRVLAAVRVYIDDAVIIDDASTDETVAVCHETLRDIPHVVIENKVSTFHNEWELRRQQWKAATQNNPDWLLFLDADEIFENSFAAGVKELTQDGESTLFSFRLYDFWDEAHYREDALWQAHFYYRPFLIKYIPGYEYVYNKTSQHCGRLPGNIYQLPNKLSEYRVKHYGWAREEDRIEKFKRYMALDPQGIYGSMAQYLSIMDRAPHLIKWTEC